MIIKLTESELKSLKIKYVGTRELSGRYLKDREKIWEEFVEAGRKIGKEFWNGELYTFEKLIQYDFENAVVELGSCEYKDRMMKKKYGPKGIEERYGKDHLHVHCGVNCFLITKDKKLVFGRKKNTTGLQQDVLAFISGNMNKDEQEVKGFEDVVRSVKSEIEEEANLKVDIDKLKFHQINHFNTYFNFEFTYQLDIDSEDVRVLNKDGEFFEFLTLSPQDILETDKPLLADLEYSKNYILDLL